MGAGGASDMLAAGLPPRELGWGGQARSSPTPQLSVLQHHPQSKCTSGWGLAVRESPSHTFLPRSGTSPGPVSKVFQGMFQRQTPGELTSSLEN